MDIIVVFLLILHICSIVHTYEDESPKIEKQDSIFNSTHETTSSPFIEHWGANSTDANYFVNSNKSELPTHDFESNSKDFAIELENDSVKNANETRKDSEEKHSNYSIVNKKMYMHPTERYRFQNSTHSSQVQTDTDVNTAKQNLIPTVKTALVSLINKVWHTMFNPLIKVMEKINLRTKNCPNNTFCNITTRRDGIFNISDDLLDNDTVNFNISRVFSDSHIQETKTSTMPNNISDSLINHSQSNETQLLSKDKLLVLKTDANHHSTVNSKSNSQITQRDQQDDVKKIIENLINDKNNSMNNETMLIFLKFLSRNYNSSEIRSLFSSRYSQIGNPESGSKLPRKREISPSNNYNGIERQELASYFHNDKKIRENYMNYGTNPNRIHLSEPIYDPDKTYDNRRVNSKFLHEIDLRLHNDPIKVSLEDNQKLSPPQNSDPDINDSTLLYLLDRLGYSILDDNEITLTTAKIDTKHVTNNSDKNVAKLNSINEIKTKKKSKKSAGHKQRINSIKKKKSKVRGKNKSKKNSKKKPGKSMKRRNTKKRYSNSTKYSKSQGKTKRKNSKQTMSKKRKSSKHGKKNVRNHYT